MPAYLDTLFLVLTFIISISLHEYAHAWTSTYFGDPTPKLQGRLTPNPLKHIDPVGFVLIFLINFWRGRPVIVNPSYYKRPLRDELLVALAGPATNLMLAVLWTLIVLIYIKVTGTAPLTQTSDPIVYFRYLFSRINVALAIFNLIPLPPLDGYRIVKFLKPTRWVRLETYRRHIGMIFILLIVLPGPVWNAVSRTIVSVAQFVYGIIHMILSFVIL